RRSRNRENCGGNCRESDKRASHRTASIGETRCGLVICSSLVSRRNGSGEPSDCGRMEDPMESQRNAPRHGVRSFLQAIIALTVVFGVDVNSAGAQTSGPAMTVPNLDVHALIEGFETPISVAFLSDTKWLVIEKMTGKVKVVEDGVITGTALDLAVNNASER